MNTKDLFNFLTQKESIINKHYKDSKKIESFKVVEANMPDENTLYVFGKKPNIKSKYAFIINNIFDYAPDDRGNIIIKFNDNIEFSLQAIS